MKPLISSFIFLCMLGVLRAESFTADSPIYDAAKILQQKIPELAVDRLFEAKRGSAEWRYAFWTKAEKTWVEEVRITLQAKNAYSSNIVVEVYRIEGGLVKTTLKPQPLAATDWTVKIRELMLK